MKIRKASIIVFLALSLVIAGSMLLLYASGIRFFTITTPSMGETAPVGTLVVTQPLLNTRPCEKNTEKNPATFGEAAI